MKLRKENINKWLEVLDRQSNHIFGYSFSTTDTNENWLEEYEGRHATDVIHDNIEAAI